MKGKNPRLRDRSKVGSAPTIRSPASAGVAETLRSLLQSHGVRLSAPRSAVIRALVSRGESHPTAEEVFWEVRRRGQRIGIATVYNTLELLRGLGAVSELGFSAGPTRFDLNLAPHANLVCTNCGRISDYELGPLADWTRKLGARANFEVRRQRLDLYGLCSDCRSREVAHPEVAHPKSRTVPLDRDRSALRR